VGGIEATLATSNTVARPQPVVTVPAGQTSANFNVTTTPVTADTVVTITAIVGTATQTANLIVTRGGAPTPTPVPTATPTPTPVPTATPTATPLPTATPTATPLPAPALITPIADARFTPGTNITFDWGDVSGAASYTIQIDDSSSFPAPLIVDQTVTTSQFSTSTLPTERMWWRVRANALSGTPGAWSASRRFEVKN
jgi:hypothetical protein